MKCTICRLFRWNGHRLTGFGWFVTITKPFIHILSRTKFDEEKGYDDFLNSLIKLRIEMPKNIQCGTFSILWATHWCQFIHCIKQNKKLFGRFFYFQRLLLLMKCHNVTQHCPMITGIKTTTKKTFYIFSRTSPSQNRRMNIWAQIKLQLKNVCCGFLVVRKEFFCSPHFLAIQKFLFFCNNIISV